VDDKYRVAVTSGVIRAVVVGEATAGVGVSAGEVGVTVTG